MPGLSQFEDVSNMVAVGRITALLDISWSFIESLNLYYISWQLIAMENFLERNIWLTCIILCIFMTNAALGKKVHKTLNNQENCKLCRSSSDVFEVTDPQGNV